MFHAKFGVNYTPYRLQCYSWSEHPPYEQEQNTQQWRTFTVTLPTLQEKGDVNGGRGRIQTPAFSIFN